MGLDCWLGRVTSEEKKTFEPAADVKFDVLPQLCKGAVTGIDEPFQFRGKVYADFVRRVSGADLYTRLSASELVRIADAIAVWLVANPDTGVWPGGRPRAEIVDLERTLRAYGVAGAECFPDA